MNNRKLSTNLSLLILFGMFVNTEGYKGNKQHVLKPPEAAKKPSQAPTTCVYSQSQISGIIAAMKTLDLANTDQIGTFGSETECERGLLEIRDLAFGFIKTGPNTDAKKSKIEYEMIKAVHENEKAMLIRTIDDVEVSSHQKAQLDVMKIENKLQELSKELTITKNRLELEKKGHENAKAQLEKTLKERDATGSNQKVQLDDTQFQKQLQELNKELANTKKRLQSEEEHHERTRFKVLLYSQRLESLDQQYLVYDAITPPLFGSEKSKFHIFLVLALNLKNIMELPKFADLTQKSKENFNSFKTKFPKVVQTIVWSPKICLENVKSGSNLNVNGNYVWSLEPTVKSPVVSLSFKVEKYRDNEFLLATRVFREGKREVTTSSTTANEATWRISAADNSGAVCVENAEYGEFLTFSDGKIVTLLNKNCDAEGFWKVKDC